VLEVVHVERRSGELLGVVVQLGGQTPLGLADELAAAGVPVLGTSPAAIRLAEDRSAFGHVLAGAGLPAPVWDTAASFSEARAVAERIGYPVLVRPSFVLGGRGMEVVDDAEALDGYVARAAATGVRVGPQHPLLVDRFLDDAVEIDVDALCDGTEVFLGGVMEHIEEAGVHSGDSACVLPPVTLGAAVLAQVRHATEAIAHGVGVVGPAQRAVRLVGDTVMVLEANPRASRTVPFVSKATDVPLAKAAAEDHDGQLHRRPAGRGHAPEDRRRRQPPAGVGVRQGGRAAVQAVPAPPTGAGRGLRAAVGDAVRPAR
jgi:carbamoyl-phosphate synthase large subunit